MSETCHKTLTSRDECHLCHQSSSSDLSLAILVTAIMTTLTSFLIPELDNLTRNEATYAWKSHNSASCLISELAGLTHSPLAPTEAIKVSVEEMRGMLLILMRHCEAHSRVRTKLPSELLFAQRTFLPNSLNKNYPLLSSIGMSQSASPSKCTLSALHYSYLAQRIDRSTGLEQKGDFSERDCPRKYLR